MSYETLIYAKAENIATVTLNRPEKRNAWTTQMSEDVVDVFKVMEDDPEVLVTVLTGTGTQAFSAGADLGNPKTHRVNSAGEHLATVSPRGFAVFNAVADYPKPVVVAINGFAVGIGCLITLCGDILLASENAELGLPQVPLGIIPAYGGAVRLARMLVVAKRWRWYYSVNGSMLQKPIVLAWSTKLFPCLNLCRLHTTMRNVLPRYRHWQ